MVLLFGWLHYFDCYRLVLHIFIWDWHIWFGLGYAAYSLELFVASEILRLKKICWPLGFHAALYRGLTVTYYSSYCFKSLQSNYMYIISKTCIQATHKKGDFVSYISIELDSSSCLSNVRISICLWIFLKWITNISWTLVQVFKNIDNILDIS